MVKKSSFVQITDLLRLLQIFCALYGLINFENRFRKFREQKVLLVITDSLDGRIGLFIGWSQVFLVVYNYNRLLRCSRGLRLDRGMLWYLAKRRNKLTEESCVSCRAPCSAFSLMLAQTQLNWAIVWVDGLYAIYV